MAEAVGLGNKAVRKIGGAPSTPLHKPDWDVSNNAFSMAAIDWLVFEEVSGHTKTTEGCARAHSRSVAPTTQRSAPHERAVGVPDMRGLAKPARLNAHATAAEKI